jgi:cellulose synthase/poly-beta-1,6-N-acetylglucosamine synthase-like glycosyltransferase
MAFFDTPICPDTNRYLSEDYMFCQWTRKAGMHVWFCPWMQLQHVGMYVFGGSLVDLAQIGAAATADPTQLKKFKK